ncbi:Beta-barrel assembly machine subunit BamB [Marinobacter daqiaonensis]|uniref:Outer membrane protein assembly factor BamB n=1 Tax=Marinobacter daqiaonensis TaxID=650891 RepID=A0A1I6GLM0_9GAMM|nr:outer membrane protein assembly factor BamB [Marinobacter daqiaonensis]SFR43068.1 Beta-barrel assembly machine subunit BamB [Marinobacter daqiaonensis]
MPCGVRLKSFLAPAAVAALAALALAGCSSTENFEEADPVPEVVSSVSLEARWSLQVGDGYDGKYLHLRPTVVGGSLYAVSADGELVAVGPATGEVRWRRTLGETIMAGVGGDSRNLYVVTADAELMALNRRDGEELWRLRMPNEVLAPPRSNGSLVLTQTIDGRVVAADTRSGERLWQFDAPSPALSVRDTAPPVVGSELALISLANGRLVALSTDSGQPVWQYTVGEPSGRTELERLVDVTAEPVIVEGAALVAGYQGKLALVDLRNGQEIWSRSTSTFHSPALGPGRIFIAEANGDLVGLDASNLDPVWTQDELSWRRLSAPSAIDDFLVVGDYEGYLHILAQEDGQFQGQNRFDKAGIRAPMVRWENRLIVYGNSGRLAAFTLNDSRD